MVIFFIELWDYKIFGEDVVLIICVYCRILVIKVNLDF